MHAQTQRQREVLDLIVRYIESNGYRPSYQTIARRLGLNSRAGIARIVHDLEAQGLLVRRRENGHFYLDIESGGAKAAQTAAEIAWLDVPTDDEMQETWQQAPISLPGFMLGGYEPATIRVFRVTDNGMEAEQICEGDLALIELYEFPRDGQRVVAVINKKRAVLRKYYRAGADVELCAGDDDEKPLRVAADKVSIKGIFRGLLRPIP